MLGMVWHGRSRARAVIATMGAPPLMSKQKSQLLGLCAAAVAQAIERTVGAAPASSASEFSAGTRKSRRGAELRRGVRSYSASTQGLKQASAA